MRLLLIEDEEKVARFIVRGLMAERFAVDVAGAGDIGLELAQAYNYDLIILDLMLPGLNGTEALRRIRRRDGSRFLIETGVSYASIENTLRGLLLTLAVGLPVVIAVAVMGGYWIMRHALRPLDEIAGGAERITSRNLSERLPVAHSGDEIERLSLALNRMIARLEESFQYIRRFTADASHELRTPLTVLRGELEAIAQRSRLDGAARDTVGSLLEETERLARIVESWDGVPPMNEDYGKAREWLVERINRLLEELKAEK